MATDTTPDVDPAPPSVTPGRRWMAGASAFYLAVLTVATWPAIPRMATDLPSRVDPIAHIWTMRWNKSCLLEGKLPFHCPDIQYPVGAALGTLPPMHFQTLLFVPLSLVFANDVLCYNIIRTAAFLITGLGTLLLAWNVVRDRWAAVLGGMLAMLSQPMLFFSQAELEQITVGWFPIFLVAWTRWVDRPSGRGLVVSAGFYVLVAMSAPYFGVFAVFPASLYVAWRWVSAWRSGASFWGWMRARLGWFAGFSAITAPLMILLFSNQIWALRHGITLTRPDGEFFICRAPLWGYVVPSPIHYLSKVLPFSTYLMGDVGSVPSYLGVVTMGLIAYAGLARVKFAGRGYWWAVFLMLLVLSLGAHAWVFGHDVSLPAAWLKKYFIGFRMIRVPARFNLFAAVGAAVVASAGLHHLLTRIKSATTRRVVFGLLTVAAVADLSVAPYQTVTVPPVPPCYATILKGDPGATFADIPQFNAGGFHLPSIAAYWQSIHGGKTSAGYTAFNNVAQDNLMYYNSPFDAFRLAQPDYLEHWEAEHFELAGDLDFRSYAWLYLTAHQLRYVVYHHNADAFPEFKTRADRVEMLLSDALIYNDDKTAVFDRDRLPKPTRPVFLYDRGWNHRVIRKGALTIMLAQVGRVLVYNPDPNRPLTLTLDASAHKAPKRVTLRADGQEVTRWTVQPSETALLASPPMTLSEGLHELTITSDGDEKPSRADAHIQGDKAPFSLWATGIGLKPAGPAAVAGRQVGDRIVR